MSATAAYKPSPTTTKSAYARALDVVGQMLDVKLAKPLDMIRLTRAGVEPVVIDELIKRGFSVSELSWIINPRSLSHRKQKQQKLSPEETGRWLRAAKIQALAQEVFADDEKASRWLHKPRKAFDGHNAMEIIQTEVGAQLVEDTLNQLDAGYFA